MTRKLQSDANTGKSQSIVDALIHEAGKWMSSYPFWLEERRDTKVLLTLPPDSTIDINAIAEVANRIAEQRIVELLAKHGNWWIEKEGLGKEDALLVAKAMESMLWAIREEGETE